MLKKLKEEDYKEIGLSFSKSAQNHNMTVQTCFENRKSVIFKNLVNGYGAGTTELHIIRLLTNTICPEYILYNFKMDVFSFSCSRIRCWWFLCL